MVSARKRIGAALAALALAFAAMLCFANPAWADEPDYNKTATFKGVQQGDTVNAYNLISYDEGYHGFVFNSQFRTYLTTSNDNWNADKPENLTNYNDDQLAEWFHGLNVESVRLVLKGYVNQWGSSAPSADTSVKAENETNPQITFGPGYYLVLPTTTQSNSALYNPVSVFVKVEGNNSTIKAGDADASTNNVEITMKSENGPTIKKLVKRLDGTLNATQTVQIGETVTYAVKINFPNYSNMGNPNPVLHDTMSGTEYVDGSVSVHKANTEGTGYEEGAIEGAISQKSVGDYTNGSQKIDFSIDYSKLNSGNGGAFYIVYRATVMSDISTGNGSNQFEGKNSARLEYWTTAAGQTSTTDPASASVYTFALNLEKLNKDSNALSGAKYTFYAADGSQIKFSKSDNGYYTVDPNGPVTEIAADEGDSHNKLEIRGLDASKTYQIEESTVPNGYYEPLGKYTLQMESLKKSDDPNEHTGNLFGNECLTAADGNDADAKLIHTQASSGATYHIKLMNSTTPSLPTTGGMGTILLTVAGVVLMIAAGTFFMLRRRKNQR